MPAPKPARPVVKVIPTAPRPDIILPTQKTIISQRPQDHVMVFYGPPGVGKTTFVNQLGEKVFFFSTDRGTRGINTMRQECLTWLKFLDTLTALEKPGAPKYDIACIDHIDDMANMADDYVCAKLKVESLGDEGLAWGAGWKAYKKELYGFIRRLAALNMGVVGIAHEDIKQITTRAQKLNRTMPGLGKSAWKAIIPMADLVGYCGFKTIKTADKGRKEVRVLETIPREDLYVKDRTRRVKPTAGWEPLNAQKFMATFVSK